MVRSNVQVPGAGHLVLLLPETQARDSLEGPHVPKLCDPRLAAPPLAVNARDTLYLRIRFNTVDELNRLKALRHIGIHLWFPSQ